MYLSDQSTVTIIPYLNTPIRLDRMMDSWLRISVEIFPPVILSRLLWLLSIRHFSRLFLQFYQGFLTLFSSRFRSLWSRFWLSTRQSRPQNGCHSTIDQGKDDHDKLLPRARLSLLTLCNREQCLINSTVCGCVLRHFPLWLLFWFQLEFHESFNPFFPSVFSLLLCNRSCRIWGHKIPRRSVISKWMSRTFCSGRGF